MQNYTDSNNNSGQPNDQQPQRYLSSAYGTALTGSDGSLDESGLTMENGGAADLMLEQQQASVQQQHLMQRSGLQLGNMLGGGCELGIGYQQGQTEMPLEEENKQLLAELSPSPAVCKLESVSPKPVKQETLGPIDFFS